MNLKAWQWFSRQSRTNQLILVIIFAASSSLGFVQKESIKKCNRIIDQDKTIRELNKSNLECEQRSGKQAKEILENELRNERERGQKLDSMLFAINAATNAVKKASKK